MLLTSLRIGNYYLDKENINIKKLLKVSIKELSQKIEKKTITTQINCPNELMFYADKELLKNAVSLVFENAIRFSRENGKINIHSEILYNQIIINISDNGSGFKSNALKNLFEFFGSGEHHLDQHVGMSLALANQIMIAHGGKIEVKNLNEGGAMVSLIMPQNSNTK